ncbi:MAG: hypothetical protein V4713_12910 [Pseudomonadota bacterium]
MSSISSISSFIQPAATLRACKDNFDINAKAYGVAAASVIGLADAAGDSGSAICSFSAESLGKLGDVAEAGYDAVSDALSSAGKAVSETTSQFVQTIEDDVSAAASSVSDAASSVAHGLSSVASSATAYLALGLAAGQQVISEIV